MRSWMPTEATQHLTPFRRRRAGIAPESRPTGFRTKAARPLPPAYLPLGTLILQSATRLPFTGSRQKHVTVTESLKGFRLGAFQVK